MEGEFPIQVNLVEEAQKQLAFLMDIEAVSDSLHQPHVIRNAIRRYETIWLPLVAEHRFEFVDLEPPLDVHWVWHVHMLCPLKYAADVQAAVGMIPDHKCFILKHQKESLMHIAKTIWQTRTSEPFDVDFDSVGDNSETQYDSVFTYNILEASDRQKDFYYNVSLPHFMFQPFLKNACKRYQKFIDLKRMNRDTFLVPMYDIDLMWHSHQLCPLAYREDTQAYLGYILNHDDSTTDRSPDSTLSRATAKTKDLWDSTYPGDPLLIPGVLYRGRNPKGTLYTMTVNEQRLVYKSWYRVEVIKLGLSGDLKDRYKIAGTLHTKHGAGCQKLHVKKGLPFVWESEHSCLVNCQVADLPNMGYNKKKMVLHLSREDGIQGSLFGKELIPNMELYVSRLHYT